MANKPITDTLVFITGSAHGIGLATAEELARQGYQVIASSKTLKDRPELLRLAEKYPKLSLLELDVRASEAEIAALIQKLPPIDILINNVGVGLVGAAESFTEAQIKEVFATNVLGVVNVTNAVLPSMRARNSGMIVTLSSIVGPLPSMEQWAYSGSKSMLEHYTASLKRDLEQNGYDGIAIANVHPGPVKTHFESATPEGARFKGQENPYPKMSENIAYWRDLLQKGHPVSEVVQTILKVIQSSRPLFWNPTEDTVAYNFAQVYCDPTGARFSKGPAAPNSDKLVPEA